MKKQSDLGKSEDKKNEKLSIFRTISMVVCFISMISITICIWV